MKITIGAWFNLPKLGSNTFALLMKCGVRYEKGMGFMLTSSTDIEAAVSIIENATGKEVELSVRCFICLNEACSDCPYINICDRRKVSIMCICSEHSSMDEAYELYKNKFASSLAE